MTAQEYKEQQTQMTNLIEDLKVKLYHLKQEYLKENAEFSIGDKVRVVQKKGNGETKEDVVFVNKVDCQSSGKIIYHFSKMKKDGTKSFQTFYAWGSGIERIELVQRAVESV